MTLAILVECNSMSLLTMVHQSVMIVSALYFYPGPSFRSSILYGTTVVSNQVSILAFILLSALVRALMDKHLDHELGHLLLK